MNSLTRSVIISTLFVCAINCSKQRNILLKEFNNKLQKLGDIEEWKTRLRTEFGESLHKLPENIKEMIIDRANKELNSTWQQLLATDYLDYKITGRRDLYENKLVERLTRLQVFVLAQVLKPRDEFMMEVVNGLWLVLEQSTWVWPAHMSLQIGGVGLPNPDQFIIDLGVGETSAFVTWVGFLLGDGLNKISPMLIKRISFEIKRRVYEPFLNHEFWWMGLNGSTNNWNIWINTNILMTALLNSDSYHRLEVINRTIVLSDNWLNSYGEDGGSSEGPAYWYESAGRFVLFYYYLSSASGHKMDFSSHQLIYNLGTYIYRVHIDQDYFFNYGDSNARLIPDPTLVYRYGQVFDNKIMRQFAAYLYRLAGKESYLSKVVLSGKLHLVFLQFDAYPKLKTIPPKAPLPSESWYPDLQLATLRTHKGSPKGLFLGVMAGNNGGSHQHNDVGNFITYLDGKPVLIDIGVGTYDSKTFSAERYHIWYFQSQWHNCPTINGIDQKDGLNYTSTNVSLTRFHKGAIFEADIAGAYPPEAQVKSWVRKLTFDRTVNTIQLTETYSLKNFSHPFKLHFITVLNSTRLDLKKGGTVVFSDNRTELYMKFSKERFDVEMDAMEVEDQRLVGMWGHQIHRVTLVSKKKDLVGKHLITFKLSDERDERDKLEKPNLAQRVSISWILVLIVSFSLIRNLA